MKSIRNSEDKVQRTDEPTLLQIDVETLRGELSLCFLWFLGFVGRVFEVGVATGEFWLFGVGMFGLCLMRYE